MTDLHQYQRYRLNRQAPSSRPYVRWILGVVVVGLVILAIRAIPRGKKEETKLTVEGGVTATDETPTNASPENVNGAVSNVNGSAPTTAFDLTTCTGPIARGKGAKRAALTFNVVSSTKHLDAILTALRDKGATADFFVTGTWATANPELFKRIADAGHGVANLGFTHTNFTTLTPEGIQEELEKTDSAFAAAVGKSSKPFWRPPYGGVNEAVTTTVKQYGYCPVLWSVDAFDWQTGATVETAKARVLEKIGDGGIAVMQISNSVTPELVGPLIDDLKAQGYTIVSLTQLLAPA